MLLGLEIPLDMATGNDNDPPVRASRRIAQLRIKKEADKSREDEAQDIEKKHKDKGIKHRDKHGNEIPGSKSDKKKRKKQRQESEEDAAMMKVY